MASSAGYNDSDVVIVAAGRSPIGNLNGCLASLKAHELGAKVIHDVLDRAKTLPDDVSEVIIGQVLTAGSDFFCNSLLVAWSLKKLEETSAKFPHSPILHNACGSMCVVLCFATKQQQKQRIVP